MALGKGGPLDIQVVGLDHQDLQVDDVLNVIGQQGFQGTAVAGLPVFRPQQNGEITVNAIQFPTVKSQLSLTAL